MLSYFPQTGTGACPYAKGGEQTMPPSPTGRGPG